MRHRERAAPEDYGIAACALLPLTLESTAVTVPVVTNSHTRLPALLDALRQRARGRGWTDAEWARRAGLPKETLCRLRTRSSCDLATLAQLAAPLEASLAVRDASPATSADGRWPMRVDRTLERRLLDLAASRSTRADDWRPLGPPYFVAGVAMMLASVPEFDRAAYLELAESLHPGIATPRVLAAWLATTPLPPARFLSAARAEASREASRAA